MSSINVCLIGAGVSGCAFLSHFARLQREDAASDSTVTCFEKQRDWGGMWNYDWRTSVDEFGEPVHCSMYRHLWTNEPKEVMEFSDYTYSDHFGRAIPSFPPRAVVTDYLKAKWEKDGIRRFVRFGHVIRRVEYDEKRGEFVVVVKDLISDADLPPLRFSHVVVASGHHSVPNAPSFTGVETFPGRVLHSHELRDFADLTDKSVLVVGGNPSAHDSALQCLKFGSRKIVVSSRSRNWVDRMVWPEGMELKPLLKRFDGRTAEFDDESTEEFDVVIFATGYLHSFPFMQEGLKLKMGKQNRITSGPLLYNLSLFLGGGDLKLFYLGMASFMVMSFFDACALWTANVIFGRFSLPTLAYMKEEAERWCRVEDETEFGFQTLMKKFALMAEIKSANGSATDDLERIAQLYASFAKDYNNNRVTFRDRGYTSIYSGKMAPPHHTRFMEAFDDSMEDFLKAGN